MMEEEICKLRLSNAYLKKQLNEVTSTLDLVLQKSSTEDTSAAAAKAQYDVARKTESIRAMRSLVASKEKLITSLKKKADVLTKQNNRYRNQLQEISVSDRVVASNQEVMEKSNQIKELLEENRVLKSAQLRYEKKTGSKSRGKKDTAASRELAVTKETLLGFKDRCRIAEKEKEKYFNLYNNLKEKTKFLQKETDGSNEIRLVEPNVAALQAQIQKFETERVKMAKDIILLEKAKDQALHRIQVEIKKESDNEKRHAKEMGHIQKLLSERDKYMRFQLLELKKLKSGLREFAIAQESLPEPVWSRELKDFLFDTESSFRGSMPPMPSIPAIPASPVGSPVLSPNIIRYNSQDEYIQQVRPESSPAPVQMTHVRIVEEKIEEQVYREPARIHVEAAPVVKQVLEPTKQQVYVQEQVIEEQVIEVSKKIAIDDEPVHQVQQHPVVEEITVQVEEATSQVENVVEGGELQQETIHQEAASRYDEELSPSIYRLPQNRNGVRRGPKKSPVASPKASPKREQQQSFQSDDSSETIFQLKKTSQSTKAKMFPVIVNEDPNADESKKQSDKTLYAEPEVQSKSAFAKPMMVGKKAKKKLF